MDLANMNKVESTKLDVSEYVGRKAKIENVEVVKTKYGESLKVSTVVLDVIETEKGKDDIELRATKMFSVTDEGEIVIGSKLDKFMTKQGVDQPLKLIGTEVQVLKNENDYLTF